MDEEQHTWRLFRLQYEQSLSLGDDHDQKGIESKED